VGHNVDAVLAGKRVVFVLAGEVLGGAESMRSSSPPILPAGTTHA
jgi:hypothetical protein